MSRDLVVVACERLKGIPESDVRDWRFIPTRDAVRVRLWNHRKVEVDGVDIVRFVRFPRG